MTALITFVQKTSYEITPNQNRLSPILWDTFTVLNKIHGVWRYYRRAELYSNPNNFLQLLAGHALNFVVGDILFIKIAAQCLLIATRILECSQQQSTLCDEGRQWILSIKGHYPEPLDLPWEKPSGTSWISPSHAYSLKRKTLSLRKRIERIALRTLHLFKEAFRLSMNIMDAIDALSFNPATHKEALNEGFVNIVKWLDAIVTNKEDLLLGIKQNKPIIEKLLKKSPISYDQLYSGIEKTIEKTELVHEKIKAISSSTGDLAIHLGKHALNTTMVVAGMANLRPVTLAT